MFQQFVDRHCALLDHTERSHPFGPETVVWKVNGHMFAAYTEDGQGLSLRTADVHKALRLIRRSSESTDAHLTGGGWIVIPWETPPDALRRHLYESYQLVKRDHPSALPRAKPAD